VHVLEVNPNPYLLSSAEFALARSNRGRSYTDLVAAIADLALARYDRASVRTT